MWPNSCHLRWPTAAGITAGRLRPTHIDAAGRLINGDGVTAEPMFEVIGRDSPGSASARSAWVPPHPCQTRPPQLRSAGFDSAGIGNASVETGERYLGVKQDLVDAPCDRLGLQL